VLEKIVRSPAGRKLIWIKLQGRPTTRLQPTGARSDGGDPGPALRTRGLTQPTGVGSIERHQREGLCASREQRLLERLPP
jgi:hypothetical protein